MTNLVLNVSPTQLVSDQGLMIAFFDKKNEVTKEHDLWVHINIPNDPHTVAIRKAVERNIYINGEKTPVHEKDLYRIAYKKYFDLKQNSAPDPERELIKAKEEIAALKAAASSAADLENEEVKEEPKKKGRPFAAKPVESIIE